MKLELSLLFCLPLLGCSTKDDDGAAEVDMLDCESLLTEADCNAAEVISDAGSTQSCAWSTWVPTTVTDDGACEFGPVQGSCGLQVAGSVGCAGQNGCNNRGEPRGHSYREADDGSLLIGTSNGWCEPPPNACTADGPAECACVCDSAWPGTPLVSI